MVWSESLLWEFLQMMMFVSSSKGKPVALCKITSLGLGGEIPRLTGTRNGKGGDDVVQPHASSYATVLKV